MTEPEFDKYANAYDHVLGEAIPAGLGEDGYFAEYKIALTASRLRGRETRRILDFGCGAGRSLPFIADHFPDSEIWGYDVSPASLEVASTRLPRARLLSDWDSLGETRFDAIIAANVFHHIPLDQRLLALSRCGAALADRGQMFLFEHNPYNPMTRWIFERCPFDADAQMLKLGESLALAGEAGLSVVSHAYTLFFPKPLSFLRRLEPMLRRLPIGAQYLVQMAR